MHHNASKKIFSTTYYLNDKNLQPDDYFAIPIL